MNNKTIEKRFNKTKFSIDQYWKIVYIVHSKKGEKNKYTSVIKSRSLESAIKFLTLKIKQEDLSLKVSISSGGMFHKDYSFKRSNSAKENLINMKDWEDIRKCSFPNENNYLFKYTH